MVSWLFALEGWQFVAGMLTCIASVVGVFIAGVGAIAKSIASSTEHDLYSCNCFHCHSIRAKAADKYDSNYNEPKALLEWNKDKKMHYGPWISTAELKPNMLLSSKKGHIYRLEEIVDQSYGVTLRLRNMVTERLSLVNVGTAAMATPMWRQAFTDERN